MNLAGALILFLGAMATGLVFGALAALAARLTGTPSSVALRQGMIAGVTIGLAMFAVLAAVGLYENSLR